MIDYSVFSQLAAARGSFFPVPLAARPLLSISAFQGQIRLRRHLVIGSQGRRDKWNGVIEDPLQENFFCADPLASVARLHRHLSHE